MSTAELARGVLRADAFRRTLMAITTTAVLRDLSPIAAPVEPGPIDWNYALRSASLLASVQTQEAQDAALRIAQTCLMTDNGVSDHHRTASAVILERMGNHRALELAESRQLLDQSSWKLTPGPLALDVIRRRLELAIPDADGDSFAGNQFQRDFWDAAESALWISVSAPTSAGKSYIVKRWIEERVSREQQYRGVYVVPTRALIDEVSQDLARTLGAEIPIFTIPWDEQIGQADRELYVLTQERFHFLQQRLPIFSATMIFVDEAQKYGDGERGVLLQRVVAEAVRRAPEGQVIFASPLSENPELLLEGAPPTAGVTSLRSETITVNQNLLWVDENKDKAKTWTVDLIHNGEPMGLGEVELDGRPVDQMKRLSLVAVALGRKHHGNLVYVNFASEAETAAKQISEARKGEVDLSDEPRIVALKELIRRTIEPRYRLVAALDSGVAFHYGNMPLLVRTEIEDLFRDGILSYLVCTSTLMEGVNLPCSNLFVRAPKKGRNTYMGAADFWNLAGRAGRWGKEFQGNIVCVDPRDDKRWPDPPVSRVRQPLQRATDLILSDLPGFRKFVTNEKSDEIAEENTALAEPVLSLLASRLSEGEALTSLAGAAHFDSGELTQLEAEIGDALQGVDIPPKVYRRHAGISPMAMQKLLDHFRMHKHPETLPLALPETTKSEENYLAALSRARNHLGAPFSKHSGYLLSRAILIRDWMKGKPLPVLISERIRFEEKRSPERNKDTLVAASIRDTMRDVEQFARFEAPKYLSCYADVLDFFLESEGLDVSPPEMDLAMMLEMGVARQSELSMMVLGLSRASAIAIEKYIIPDDLKRDQCLAWLSGQDLETLDVPALVRDEIARIVQIHGVEPTNEAMGSN